jgi:hypothetical protein
MVKTETRESIIREVANYIAPYSKEAADMAMECVAAKKDDRINVNAEFICEFNNFEQWVNYASRTLGRARKTRNDILLCVDTAGNTCVIGEDFMFARDNHLFPVKAYRIPRSIEYQK